MTRSECNQLHRDAKVWEGGGLHPSRIAGRLDLVSRAMPFKAGKRRTHDEWVLAVYLNGEGLLSDHRIWVKPGNDPAGVAMKKVMEVCAKKRGVKPKDFHTENLTWQSR